jgi:protein ImuB
VDDYDSLDGRRMTEPLYICVYVPEFPAQARLRLRPELASTPVVILAGDPPLEEVCSANALAFRLGITQGMTRAELESFAGVSVLKRSEQEERGARAALLDAAGAFTPRVEMNSSTVSAFAIVLDMAGTRRIFGPTTQALKSIQRAFSALRFFTQLAASSNFHAAVCMAPQARKEPFVLQAGREREILSTLPLSALPLTSSQFESLALWGLHTVGELAGLPEVDLIVRLGQAGKRLRLLARGEHPHLMVPEEPAFILDEFIGFDAPIETLDSLLFVLGPMLEQVLARAQNRAYALASVTLRLGLDGGGEHERTIKPAIPTVQRDALLKLLHLDLQAHPPGAGVISLLLHAEPGDRNKVQLGLFSTQLPEPLRLDMTLARIAALVGEERVGRAKLRDTHRPDSFTMERFGVPGGVSIEVDRPMEEQQVTALRRCRPPVLLSVQQCGACLKAFSFHGRRYTVRETYGPWRKSGDWWSAGIWSREEWDVCATTSGNDDAPMLCLVTHDLLQHRWHLEALYD